MDDKRMFEHLPLVNFHSTERFILSYDAMNAWRRHVRFCDVQFVIGDRKFFAHKLILASHSDHFNKILLDESDSREFIKVVEIKNKEVTLNSFQLLIDFMYTSELIIHESNWQELLIASRFLLLDDVKNECLKYVEKIINADNYMTIKEIAILNDVNELYETFLSFMLHNFIKIVQTHSFLSIPFELLMELIQSDDLHAEEKEIYEASMLWLKHDIPKRLHYLPQLMKVIRLNLLPINYLDSIQKEDLIKSNVLCMNYLCEAYKVQLGKRIKCDEILSNCNFKRRKCSQLIVIYTWNNANGECLLEWMTTGKGILVTNNFSWKSSNSSIILNDGRIFCTNYSLTNKNWSPSIFDGNINQWYNITDFQQNSNVGKPMLNLVELNNYVYVMSSLGNFGRYNIKDKEWTNLTGIERTYYVYDGLVVSDGVIYNVSSFNVLQYCSNFNKWLVISQTSHNLGLCSAICCLNGFLYVVGGEKKKNENLKSAMKFDLSTNTWKNIANMNVGRSSAGAVAINGKIYVMGGENCDNYEIYDPQSNKWTLSKYKSKSKKHILTRAFILDLEMENVSNYYST